jgi:hypothetical protein
VLVREADGAVALMRDAGAEPRCFARADLGDGDLEPRVSSSIAAKARARHAGGGGVPARSASWCWIAWRTAAN